MTDVIRLPSVETPKTIPPEVDQAAVGGILRRRVCARCYGDLVKSPGSQTFYWAISCPTCGDTWQYTTVSRHYAEMLGQDAVADLNEAQRRFADMLPPKPQKSQAQILSELGF